MIHPLPRLLDVRCVFLDRDGVLNRAFVRGGKPYPPSTMEEFEILPGVRDGLEMLKAAGFLTVVTTNQPDVRAGKQSLRQVNGFHRFLEAELPLDDIKCCFHIAADNCFCRKPLPGMLFEAAKSLDIDLAESHMVGDRWRDVWAGQNAGCRSFLVDYGYAETPDKLVGVAYTQVRSLYEAATIITEEVSQASISR